jgi:Flp pilus assembly protein TadD
VLKYSDEALLTDPNYPKALYHKGKAQIELSDFTHALESLSLAATLDSGNSEIQKEIARGE